MTGWAPLLLHVVCRFDTSGLENGAVNLINRMPWEADRHMVLAPTEELQPALRERLRLDLGGDGPLAAEAQSMLAAADVRHLAWVRGERIDVPDVMCGLGGFVLVSQAEGISNSILEAMACACPVLATRVGGNAERVDARTASTTGELVPPGDVEAMARALAALAADWVRAARMGKGRVRRVEQHFSLQAMVGDRQGLCAWPLCRS